MLGIILVPALTFCTSLPAQLRWYTCFGNIKQLMAYIVVAYIVVAYIVMAYIVVVYIVAAYTVVAYIAMAPVWSATLLV